MRGAWLWPTFLALTALGSVVLRKLPFYDAAPRDLYGTTLVVGFANLFAVAVLAPGLARLIRRRRPDLPRDIARNYAGTALVVAFFAWLLVGGVIHRPVVQERRADAIAQFGALHDFVVNQAPAYRDGLGAADVLRLEEDLYRSCVPGPGDAPALCLIISTDQRPPGVRRDPDSTPN